MYKANNGNVMLLNCREKSKLLENFEAFERKVREEAQFLNGSTLMGFDSDGKGFS